MARASDPTLARAAALAVIDTLRAHGHIAYLAGGCVRDELLGLHPTDYDVATDATPDRIQSLFVRTAEVGASFGVVLVKPGRAEGLALPAGARVTIEVATFRADGPYSDRRRPDSITFSDPRSDALRRDFTMNALFLDPHAARGGGAGRGIEAGVIDFVGGLADLRAGVVRAVGEPDARLAEDHLRALRAVRFAARFGFALEERTAEAIRAHARELRGVSRERIGEELRRMLAHPSFALAVRTLVALRLDAPVLDEAHSEAPTRLVEGLAAGSMGGAVRPAPAWTTVVAAWLVDRAGGDGPVPGPTLARVRRALCLSNDESEALAAVLRCREAVRGGWLSWPVARQKRAAAHADGPGGAFSEALRLVTAQDGPLAVRVAGRLDELRATPSGLAPEPLVDGDDLVRLGHRPGPAFRPMLDHLYDAQLEDRVRTRDEALALLRDGPGG